MIIKIIPIGLISLVFSFIIQKAIETINLGILQSVSLLNIFIIAFIGILLTSPLLFPMKHEFWAIFVSIFEPWIVISSFADLLSFGIIVNS